MAVADRVEYPVLVRPSYVLGGRAMEIVYDEAGLRAAMAALAASAEGGAGGGLSATRPVLIDRFLEDATEVDVDAVRDASGEVLIGGVMEHIEEAGVHSGDSACAIPPPTLPGDVVAVIERHTRALADALDVVGVINVQYAVKDGTVYILEANPRASRTVPFVSKATAVPLAKVAARLMVGATLAELRAEGLIPANAGADGGGHVAVKEAALPFDRFGVDTILGPEMRSTGEVMGIDRTFGVAFAKSQTAVGNKLPDRGSVFLSLADRDKPGRPHRRTALRRPRLHHRRHRRHRRRLRSRGHPRRRGGGQARPRRTRHRRSASTPSTSSPPARSTSSSTPPGAAAPAPTAPTSASPPAPTASPASRRSPPPSPPPPASPNRAPRSPGSAPCRSTTSTPSSAIAPVAAKPQSVGWAPDGRQRLVRALHRPGRVDRADDPAR